MQGYALEIRFKKTGMMKYISHLDLLRLFQRASRRAALPLSLTEGFNPHPKIKIEPALKLGLESSQMKAEIALSEELEPGEAKKRIQREMPRGVEIIEITAKE